MHVMENYNKLSFYSVKNKNLNIGIFCHFNTQISHQSKSLAFTLKMKLAYEHHVKFTIQLIYNHRLALSE